VNQLLRKEIESYGTIKITDEGLDFLKHPTSFMLAEDRVFDDVDSDDTVVVGATKASGGADKQLLGMLKELTRKVAKQKGLPPYAIFQEPSLEDMALRYPITVEELKNTFGVGDGKARKFGKPFIELIARYVEDNDIERPDDLIVKSVVNKSGLKVYIIQKTDQKMDLKEIAQSKNLELADLIKELEHIVNSGTKVNIDYYLEHLLDEDEQEEILDYFKEESETGDIEEAMEYFEGDYEEDQLKLMKIKFLSDEAN